MTSKVAFRISSTHNYASASDDAPGHTVRDTISIVGDTLEPALLVKRTCEAVKNSSGKKTFDPMAIFESDFGSSVKLRIKEYRSEKTIEKEEEARRTNDEQKKPKLTCFSLFLIGVVLFCLE